MSTETNRADRRSGLPDHRRGLRRADRRPGRRDHRAGTRSSRSALLPLLHLVQSVEGFVSQNGIEFCGRKLGLTEAEVSAVATFYTMYKRTPCGEHLVSVCTNALCAGAGRGRHLRDAAPSTSASATRRPPASPARPGSITLEHAECLAACDHAPVLQVNYEYYDNQTPDSALDLVTALQAGERPPPTRGAPLTDFRSVELEIAGIFTDLPTGWTRRPRPCRPCAGPCWPSAPTSGRRPCPSTSSSRRCRRRSDTPHVAAARAPECTRDPPEEAELAMSSPSEPSKAPVACPDPAVPAAVPPPAATPGRGVRDARRSAPARPARPAPASRRPDPGHGRAAGPAGPGADRPLARRPPWTPPCARSPRPATSAGRPPPTAPRR